MYDAIIVISAIVSLVTLIVFFVMAGNIAAIKTRLDKIVGHMEGGHESAPAENEGNQPHTGGLLVVDLKTEKQMRVGERREDGSYRCYAGGVVVGDFFEEEFMEFDKWVKEVYKQPTR